MSRDPDPMHAGTTSPPGTLEASREVSESGPREVHRDTKEALLDAAERLFASTGVQATSLRAITEAAGANVASIHYHFGSKEALVKAVLERRLRPINEERLRLLAALELRGRPSTEEILDAFLLPAFRLDPGSYPFLSILGRLHFEADPKLLQLLIDNFGDVIDRFADALARSCGHLELEDVYWRLHFAFGAMATAIANRQTLEQLAGERVGEIGSDEARRRLVRFLAAGFGAPSGTHEPPRGEESAP